MCREVQVIHRAVDIVDVAVGKHLMALFHPRLDPRHVSVGQYPIPLGFDLSVADVHNGDLVHLDPALAVFGINAEHRRPVVTDAEVIFWQCARHLVDPWTWGY